MIFHAIPETKIVFILLLKSYAILLNSSYSPVYKTLILYVSFSKFSLLLRFFFENNFDYE